MSHPKMTSQKPNPFFSADLNLERDTYLPRHPPSTSNPPILTSRTPSASRRATTSSAVARSPAAVVLRALRPLEPVDFVRLLRPLCPLRRTAIFVPSPISVPARRGNERRDGCDRLGRARLQSLGAPSAGPGSLQSE